MEMKEVLHGLENEISRAEQYDTEWNDCVPVWILRGAYELLKEQEPIEPISYMDGVVQRFTCRKCGRHLLYARWGRYDFCPYCGQGVKWDA